MPPNPAVGAVVVDAAGRVAGEGWHRRLGGPHAEVEALARSGDAARGGTLYVTLEPCAHHGRTPPCADAVIAAGLRRVVACHRDPDPRVDGGGFARLRAAGIAVEAGFLVEQAVRLNWRFLVSRVLGRPAVTVKWAMSLDGKIATAGGDSRWISSPAGRRWALGLREEHAATLVGSGTVLADDPRLDRRLGLAGGPNLRVVVDRRGRVEPSALLFQQPGEVLIYSRRDAGEADRIHRLAARGAQVIALADPTPAAVLGDLWERGVDSVLVEGGGRMAGAFVEAGLFDRVAALAAPLLIGGERAPTPFAGAGFEPLAAAPRLDDLRVERRGSDVVLTAFRAGCLPGLSSRVAA